MKPNLLTITVLSLCLSPLVSAVDPNDSWQRFQQQQEMEKQKRQQEEMARQLKRQQQEMEFQRIKQQQEMEKLKRQQQEMEFQRMQDRKTLATDNTIKALGNNGTNTRVAKLTGANKKLALAEYNRARRLLSYRSRRGDAQAALDLIDLTTQAEALGLFQVP